jgi:hypothetical protein
MSGDPARALAKLLRAEIVNFMNFVNFPSRVEVTPVASTAWASITFTGARHSLRAVVEGPGAVGAAADFLASVEELDLPIPGHIVADICLVAQERGDGGGYAYLELEALTIEDC